jgi:hypothetical protein
MLWRVVDQPRLARVLARADPREGRAQRVGVERVEQEDDQITARIDGRPCVFVDEANIAASDVEAS